MAAERGEEEEGEPHSMAGQAGAKLEKEEDGAAVAAAAAAAGGEDQRGRRRRRSTLGRPSKTLPIPRASLSRLFSTSIWMPRRLGGKRTRDRRWGRLP